MSSSCDNSAGTGNGGLTDEEVSTTLGDVREDGHDPRPIRRRARRARAIAAGETDDHGKALEDVGAKDTDRRQVAQHGLGFLTSRLACPRPRQCPREPPGERGRPQSAARACGARSDLRRCHGKGSRHALGGRAARVLDEAREPRARGGRLVFPARQRSGPTVKAPRRRSLRFRPARGQGRETR